MCGGRGRFQTPISLDTIASSTFCRRILRIKNLNPSMVTTSPPLRGREVYDSNQSAKIMFEPAVAPNAGLPVDSRS